MIIETDNPFTPPVSDPILALFLNDSSKFFSTRATHFVTLCPQGAAGLLKYNTENRPLNPSNLEFVMGDMKADQWVDWVTDISFSISGFMTNGQHQCEGAVRTGKTIKVRLTFGLPDKALAVYDTGRKRTRADAAALVGFVLKNASAMTSFHTAFPFIGADKILMGGASNSPSNLDFTSWLALHQDDVAPAVNAGCSLYNAYGVKITEVSPKTGKTSTKTSSYLSKTEAAVVWWMISQSNSPEIANAFFNQLKYGARGGKGENDPLTALDAALGALKPLRGHAFWRRVAITIHVWNTWAAVETLSQVMRDASFNVGHNMPKAKRISALRKSLLAS